MRPTITAITTMLEKPATAIIPSVARIQRISKTPAICLIGEGRIPIAQAITNKINTSQIETACPLMTNKILLRKGKAGI